MSQIQLVELYSEMAKLSTTEAMDVTATEARLVLERLFHELGDLPSTESITVLVDFLGVNDSKQNLKEFLDEVSEELDTADTKISRAKVGRVVSVFFKLLHHFKFDEALEICSRLYHEGRTLNKPKRRKKNPSQ